MNFSAWEMHPMRKRTTTQFKSIRINHINRIKVQKKIEQQQSKQKRKKEIIDLREKKKEGREGLRRYLGGECRRGWGGREEEEVPCLACQDADSEEDEEDEQDKGENDNALHHRHRTRPPSLSLSLSNFWHRKIEREREGRFEMVASYSNFFLLSSFYLHSICRERLQTAFV